MVGDYLLWILTRNNYLCDNYRKQYVGRIHTTDIKDTYGGGHCTIRHGYLFCRESTSACMVVVSRLRSISGRGCFALEVVAKLRYRCDDFLGRSTPALIAIS